MKAGTCSVSKLHFLHACYSSMHQTVTWSLQGRSDLIALIVEFCWWGSHHTPVLELIGHPDLGSPLVSNNYPAAGTEFPCHLIPMPESLPNLVSFPMSVSLPTPFSLYMPVSFSTSMSLPMPRRKLTGKKFHYVTKEHTTCARIQYVDVIAMSMSQLFALSLDDKRTHTTMISQWSSRRVLRIVVTCARYTGHVSVWSGYSGIRQFGERGASGVISFSMSLTTLVTRFFLTTVVTEFFCL